MSVTQINAGTQHNVVPDKCSFVVDVRSNELYSNVELLELIRKEINGDIEARSTRLSSSATPLNHSVVNRIKSLNRTIYGSPTLSDQALMSFASVKIGPGHSSRSHTADEFILLSEIDEAIDIYIKILDGLQLTD
jgi:acetylornithine deacetylase